MIQLKQDNTVGLAERKHAHGEEHKKTHKQQHVIIAYTSTQHTTKNTSQQLSYKAACLDSSLK